MHEYSIVQALVTQVEEQVQRHQARAVHAVWVQIGELSGVEVSLLETAYDLFREDTVCARAPLRVETVSATWECRTCGATRASAARENPSSVARGRRRNGGSRPAPSARLGAEGPLRCDLCSGEVRLARGDEIVLARLELEVA